MCSKPPHGLSRLAIKPVGAARGFVIYWLVLPPPTGRFVGSHIAAVVFGLS